MFRVSMSLHFSSAIPQCRMGAGSIFLQKCLSTFNHSFLRGLISRNLLRKPAEGKAEGLIRERSEY